MTVPTEFEKAWTSTGYMYGPDELEAVKLGWELHEAWVNRSNAYAQLLAGFRSGLLTSDQFKELIREPLFAAWYEKNK
jgi:hypothetical protein